MSVQILTAIAFITTATAALCWIVASLRQFRMGYWLWALGCLAGALLWGYFAGGYMAVLTGRMDSLLIGQSYLRPALAPLGLLMAALSLKYWAK